MSGQVNTSQPNNGQAARMITMSVVLPGASRFKFHNVSDTYRCQLAVAPNDIRSAFIKDLPAKELANELMVAATATLLGLPSPTPHLSIVRSGVMPLTHAPTLSTGDRVVFGSQDAGSPPIALHLWDGTVSPAAKKLIRDRVSKWPQLGATFGLDTWMANTDRHEGNLLMGAKGEFWLIDHGRCFGGDKWMAADLDPSKKFPDRMSGWLTPHMDSGDRTRASGDASAFAKAAATVDVRSHAQLNHVASLLDDLDFDALVKFLSDRTAHVSVYAADALGCIV